MSLTEQTPVSKWPKVLPQLTPEQGRVREDFMEHWHNVLPQKYGVVEKFNHGYAAKFSVPGTRTLEIGAGLGEHLEFEPRPAPGEYVCNELRDYMAAEISRRHPEVEVVVGDCQEGLPFPDASFDRVMAIHVLEHLPNLPAAVRELRRLVKPGGHLIAVIPCEGGFAYTLGRRISASGSSKSATR